MKFVVGPGLLRSLDRIPQAAAVVAVTVGGFVVIGWMLNLAVFKSVFPGLTAMKVNTALGFILSGIALWTALPSEQRHPFSWVSQTCAASVLLLGLLTLGEYLGQVDLGIDQLLMPDITTLPGDIPGRMAVNTAISFSALGAALLLLRLNKRGMTAAIYTLSAIPVLLAGSAFISYTYNIDELVRVKLGYTPMAINTAGVFLLLAIGILNARPYYPFRRYLSSDSAAGGAVRHLLPASIGFTYIAGWLVLKGYQASHFSETTGLALFVAANIAGLATLILWYAGMLSEAGAQREQAEADLRKSALYARSLIEASLDPLVTINAEGKITDVNEATVCATGVPRENLIGSDFSVYFTEPDKARTSYQEVFAKGFVTDYPLSLRHASGSVMEVLYNARVYCNEQGEVMGVFAAARDITEHKRAEQHIQRLNQIYAALSQTNNAIVHCSGEAELLAHICRIAVERGGMAMAWIGRIDRDTGHITPVASHGTGLEYLNGIHISIDSNLAEGQGPTGTAGRDNHPVISSNFFGDSHTSPWHERARQYGWGSSAALPIVSNGVPYAVLTVYHRLNDAFDQPIVDLLLEMAADIGYALDALDIRKQQEIAQAKLLTTQLVLESSPTVLWRWRAADDWPVEFVSENVSRYGYSASDFLSGGMVFSRLVHPDDLLRMVMEIEESSANETTSFEQQYRIICKDGSVRWLDDRTTVLRDEQGNITHYQGVTLDITEQKITEEALRQSEERFRTIYDSASDAIFVHDLYGKLIDVNHRACEMYGYTKGELLQLSIQDISSGIPPYTEIEAQRHIRKALKNRAEVFEWQARNKDQRLFWVQVSILRTNIDEQERLLVTVSDIDERRKAEFKLALDAEIFRRSHEGIMITDAKGTIISVNQAFTDITGFDEAEALGQNPRMLHSGRQDAEFYRHMWETIIRTGLWQGEIWNRRKNGEIYPEWLDIKAVKNDFGHVTHYIGVFSDVSTHKHMEERITQLTRYDPVTGLPNLFFFDDLLDMAIIEAGHQHQSIAVVRMDIENFHGIDDQFGFETGDQVLKVIADRLTANAGDEGLVTRLDKDSFTIAYPRIRDATQASLLANDLLLSISQPVEIDRFELTPIAKLGVSFYPSDGVSPMELVQKAGIALNQAKSEKGSNLRFFTQQMNDSLLARIALTNDLRRAVERGEFELYYQPQVDMASYRILALEALVRWNHPTNGLLLPHEFVALADETGLIQPLGDWVLQQAISQMKAWHDAGFHQDLSVTVNASSLQLESPQLVNTLENVLRETGLPARCFELELTENTLMSHAGDTQALLQRLKSMGICLSVDDFGAGYSSLAYLKQLTVNKLKIDKRFIDHVTTDPNDAVIVKATVAVGHSLGLTVIAKGVETQAQASYLRSLQCDQLQGYVFSPPLPAHEILPLLRNQHLKTTTSLPEGKRTLLLVDDEPNVLSSLKRILRRDGYEIITAENAEQAFEMLAQYPVGVIVSDQRMPKMTGVEFFSRVKVMYPQTMRIVLSGYTEVNTITESVNKGEIYKFLTKPWEDNELRETIKEAFQRHEKSPLVQN